jgi:hypothetical protein
LEDIEVDVRMYGEGVTGLIWLRTEIVGRHEHLGVIKIGTLLSS